MRSSVRQSFRTEGEHFLLNDQPYRIFSGEIHYFRIPKEYWRHRLRCAKAMGLNTISTYMPWNLHEEQPGQFDFTGSLAVDEFLKIAQEEGLYAILRPGPYICSEWDFGGLPAWLLATADIKVRCMDSRYLQAVEHYFQEVGQRLKDFQIHRGGNVLMVQVENEYGAFGNDRQYMDFMVALVKKVGFDRALYTSDWAKPANLKAGEVAGAVTVANFGSRADEQISLLKQLRPHQPLMCGEFWAGWFDAWGGEHQGAPDPAPLLKELHWMLVNNTSFNLYMFHGGTTFGLMAGANHYESWTPTISSYDFGAPLDEAGRPTEKYHALRKLLSQYQSTPLFEVPAQLPIQTIETFVPTESAPLLKNLPQGKKIPQPCSMEALGQNFGLILYRTEIAGLGDQDLEITEVHDFAQVWLNGKPAGTLDRRKHEQRLALRGVDGQRAVLEILIDTMGRTNFGPKILDRKGITDRVTYGDLTLMGWEAFNLPLDRKHIESLVWETTDETGPAFHRGYFSVKTPVDTFIDLSEWGRGVVWVNGRCLSRFWNIGPQRTAYLPGTWLVEGLNEVIVLETHGGGRKPLRGLANPILDAAAQ